MYERRPTEIEMIDLKTLGTALAAAVFSKNFGAGEN
jgi:hypothetical protein